MKASCLSPLFLFISVFLFGQNENPYSQFGYEATIIPQKTQLSLADKFVDHNGMIVKADTLSSYSVARWLSPDPYGQFASPYLGMGNIPNMGTDPDGGLLNPFNFTGAFVGAAIGAGIGLAFDKDNWGWYALGGVAAGGFLTSDFAKVEIWGTHKDLLTHRKSLKYNDIQRYNYFKIKEKFTGNLVNGKIESYPNILGRIRRSSVSAEEVNLKPYSTKVDANPSITPVKPLENKIKRVNLVYSSDRDYTQVYSNRNYLQNDRDAGIENWASKVYSEYLIAKRTMNVHRIFFMTHTNIDPNLVIDRIRERAIGMGVPNNLFQPKPILGPGKNFIDVLFLGK
jgi:hypothetical protein